MLGRWSDSPGWGYGPRGGVMIPIVQAGCGRRLPPLRELAKVATPRELLAFLRIRREVTVGLRKRLSKAVN